MRHLWYSINRMIQRNVVRPFWYILGSPTHGRGLLYWLSFRWLGRPLARFVQRFFIFKPPRWLTSVTAVTAPPKAIRSKAQYFNPFFWIAWFFQFLVTWLLTRPYLNLGPSLPALIAIGLLFASWINNTGVTANKIDDYTFKMNIAMSQEKWEEARIAARTLTTLLPDNQEYRRQLATIETKCGNNTVAAEMMNYLVRTQADGVAALWLIENVLKLNRLAEWTPEEHRYFRQLIDVALVNAKGENLDTSKAIMGFYMGEGGNFSEATRYFSEIAPRNPHQYRMAAIMAKRAGQDRAAVDYAREGLRFFRQAISINPSNVDFRIAEAQCYMLMNNHEQAVKSLGDAFAALRDESLRIEIGKAYVEWSNELGKQGNASKVLVQRLELLRRAIAISPNNPLVAESVADLVIECAENRDREVEVLRAALAQGISPGMMHFVEGTAALINGDSATARARLELAAQTLENVPALLNNLASAMSEGENANLPRALELVNMADERLPNHPYIHETRGQIYYKQQDYAKAIPDLEFSLRAQELRLGAYNSLRVAYKEIGQTDLANSYEKLYDDLKVLTEAAKDTNLKADEIRAPSTKETTPQPATEGANLPAEEADKQPEPTSETDKPK